MENEKLIRLREKKKTIVAQIKREEAHITAKKRKDDTRRKILVGAAILDKASRDEQYGKWLEGLLNGFLQRPDERALFELPPLPPAAPTPADNQDEAT